jgi:hypothetical protein
MRKPKRKITQKRFGEFSRYLKARAVEAESVSELMRVHRALVRGTLLYNLEHNRDGRWSREKFRPPGFGVVLKLNHVWKGQREIRRWMIQRHPTFFCPISGACLDMDRSFILEGKIFDFEALEKLTPFGVSKISLESIENLWGL